MLAIVGDTRGGSRMRPDNTHLATRTRDAISSVKNRAITGEEHNTKAFTLLLQTVDTVDTVPGSLLL